MYKKIMTQSEKQQQQQPCLAMQKRKPIPMKMFEPKIEDV